MFSIETTSRFDDELLVALDYIALDSLDRALQFHDTLMEKLHTISSNPLMYRQREGADEHVRELIFKGYTIPYYIDYMVEKIYILGIFNQNIWE